MLYTPADLALTLARADEDSWVRVAADWLTRGELSEEAPPSAGNRIRDALVAATVAHLARQRGCPAPAWTNAPWYTLDSFWHPGSDRFFALALATAPAEFAARGVFVGADSLVSL
ncbi:MAG: hypothetical protein ACRDKL_05510 [Solirubrobacteraceae bacterium]